MVPVHERFGFLRVIRIPYHVERRNLNSLEGAGHDPPGCQVQDNTSNYLAKHTRLPPHHTSLVSLEKQMAAEPKIVVNAQGQEVEKYCGTKSWVRARSFDFVRDARRLISLLAAAASSRGSGTNRPSTLPPRTTQLLCLFCGICCIAMCPLDERPVQRAAQAAQMADK